MPTRRAMKIAIERRRERIAELYLQGWTQAKIAEELGLSQGTISLDLKAIQKQWRQSTVRDFDLARETELRKIDRVEREAWQGWERSQKPQQEACVEGEPPHQRTRKRVKNQNGDPRYLEIIRNCIADRRAILGLDAPTKIAPTTPDGKPLTFEQRRMHINAILVEQFGLGVVRQEEEQRMLDYEPGGSPQGPGAGFGRGAVAI